MYKKDKQPKIGRIWAKPNHITEHSRIVKGLNATIQMLLSSDSFNSKRVRLLTEENNALRDALRAKFATFEEYDRISKTFSYEM